MTESASLADLLRTYRIQARLSQESLAERAGVSTRTVSDIECGAARSPRAMTLSLLAEALGLAAGDRETLLGSVRAPQAAGEQARSNVALPLLDRLLGRDDDLATARRRILDDGVRLMTILGPPGVGKSALARHLAQQLAPSFERVVALDAAATLDATAVPAAIAQATELRRSRPEYGAADIAEGYIGRRSLLLLDNFEHLVDAAQFVEALLVAAPTLTILVTSRVPLRLRQEQGVPLGPLALVDPKRADPDTVAANPSVQLLLERARALASEMSVTPANAAAVAGLVAALEGFPLAIELAAPLLRVLTPAALLARLEQRLPMLGEVGSQLPARHRTMRDAIASSYHLLSAEAQRAFRRFAVFRATFTVQAAQMVLTTGEAAPGYLDALRMLSQLAEQSLLRVTHDTEDPQFEFSPFVREYASELLQASNESDDAHEALVAFCTTESASVTFADATTHTPENLERLALQASSVDAALTWLRAKHRTEDALRLAIAVYAYWWLRAPAPGLQWMQSILEDAAAAQPSIDDALLATAYTHAAALCEQAGALAAADVFANKALEIRRRNGDELGVAAILNGLGGRAIARGAYEGALAAMHEALAIRRRLGNDAAIAMSLSDLACAAIEAGDNAEAAGYLEESLALFRKTDNQLGIGVALALLGIIAQREGMLDRAEIFSREAIAVATPMKYAPTIAQAQRTLAAIALERGDYAAAQTLAQGALALYASEHAAARTGVLELLAEISLKSGDGTRAARLIGAAATIRKREHLVVAGFDRIALDRLIEAIKSTLGESAYETEALIGGAVGV